MTGESFREPIKVFYTDDIERVRGETAAPDAAPPVEGVYALFRKLRAIGLMNDEILVVIDRAVLGKTFREITDERNYTHYRTAHARYQAAIQKLKARGFGKLVRGRK